jgi:hypothetical protein
MKVESIWDFFNIISNTTYRVEAKDINFWDNYKSTTLLKRSFRAIFTR